MTKSLLKTCVASPARPPFFRKQVGKRGIFGYAANIFKNYVA